MEISFERPAQTVKENVGCIPVQLKSRGLYAELFKISFTCAEVAPVEAKSGYDINCMIQSNVLSHLHKTWLFSANIFY